MELILGKNYKWWFCAIYILKSETAFFFSSFLWILSNVINFLFIVLVWSFSQRSDTNQILSYLLIGNIFFALTNFNCIWELGNNIRDGKIASKLMTPSSILMRYFCVAVSNNIIYTISIFIVLVPLVFFFKNQLDFNLNNFWYFIPFFIIASGIRFFMQFIFGSLSFWFTGNHGITQTYETLLPFLAGSLLPFDILGNHFSFLSYTPFAYTFYHPMQIYLGKYSPEQTFLTIVVGIVWCVFLYIFSKVLFALGLKKNESVGL